MPFTLAHPAAALPLRHRLGRFGSTSALVIGSMVPDLAHFVPIGLMRDESHSLAGLFWYCLPVGVVAYAIWQSLLRPFGIALAPAAIRQRLRPAPRAGPSKQRALAVAVSILVGAAGHLAWDSFTHASGAVVQAFPLLETRVPIVRGYSPCLYTVLQHVSTLVGLAILAAWTARWYVRTPVQVPPADGAPATVRGALVGVIAVPTAIAGIAAAWPYFLADRGLLHSLRASLSAAMLCGGMVFLGLLVATATIWRLRDRSGSSGRVAEGSAGAPRSLRPSRT